jgi:hypothetical protein
MDAYNSWSYIIYSLMQSGVERVKTIFVLVFFMQYKNRNLAKRWFNGIPTFEMFSYD